LGWPRRSAERGAPGVASATDAAAAAGRSGVVCGVDALDDDAVVRLRRRDAACIDCERVRRRDVGDTPNAVCR